MHSIAETSAQRFVSLFREARYSYSVPPATSLPTPRITVASMPRVVPHDIQTQVKEIAVQSFAAPARPSEDVKRDVAKVEARLKDIQTEMRFLINPNSKKMQYWDLVTLAALLFTLTVTPYEVALLPTKWDALLAINQVCASLQRRLPARCAVSHMTEVARRAMPSRAS